MVYDLVQAENCFLQPAVLLRAEFDPYFNYRVTQFLTKEGFYDTWNWFDTRTWYPLGRVVGGTMYPVCTALATCPAAAIVLQRVLKIRSTHNYVNIFVVSGLVPTNHVEKPVAKHNCTELACKRAIQS